MVLPVYLGCSASFLTWSDNCTRSYFQSLPALVFVVFLLCRLLPWPESGPVRKFINAIKSPFTLFLSLNEAEAILNPELAVQSVVAKKAKASVWLTAILATLALGEAVSWLIIGSYNVIFSNGTIDYHILVPYINAVAWLIAVITPIFEPQATVPYKLFIFYSLQLIASVFQFGSIWYDYDILGIPLRTLDVVGGTLNLFVVSALLVVVLRMPLNVPTNDEIAEKIGTEISPEDYASLWRWFSFEWMFPLIRKGTYETLNESDVWSPSLTMQSKPVYEKFISVKRRTLLRRILASNSLDLLLDFTLSLFGVILIYSQPYFLKGILEALEQENSPEARSRAYIYAFLMFFATLLYGETDLHHSWYAGRATVRNRCSLMAAIYAKALVRKDFSGIIDKKEGEGSSEGSSKQPPSKSPSTAGTSETQPLLKGDNKKGGKAKKKEEDPKNTLGADIGKIVNLMSGDVSRLSWTISGVSSLYSAPFQIVIASVFLYQLLGISAFAGFSCMIIAMPLNSYLAKKRVRIFKDVLAARDKRMGLVNELLSAVKLVKFYAWENRWMDRVLDARTSELKWLVKSRTNQVFFNLLWSSVPVFVSVISFLAYVLLGHELTIPVAFTSIALFDLLREPLNVIPAWVVQIIQAKVSLDRIAVYLDEDEVSEEMSALKHAPIDPSLPDDDRLGILSGSFKWNELPEENKKEEEKMDMKGRILNLFKKRKSLGSVSETDPGDSVSVTGQRPEDQKFELRDINVVFPEGKLTLVTGPTASGKSALLMALLGEMTMLPGNGKILLPKHRSRPDRYGNRGISYAAQTPFLQHQSIRENILFGTPYDEERYGQTLECCALKPDLEIFEDGDLTEIGSTGISLSGGQKARVALARAVYARSQCVLLDDPLSAVDSHTALSLYEKLLKGPLLANRTVVLVSHNVELVLPGADYLVKLLDGRIDVQGTPDDLRKEGLLETLTEDSHADSQNKLRDAKDEAAIEETAKPAGEEVNKRPRQLVKDETRETGGVKWQIYKTYLKASGYHTWILLVIGIVLVEVLAVAEKLWIKQWGDGYDAPTSMHYFTYHEDGDWDFRSPPAMRVYNAFRNTTQLQSVSRTAITLPSATTHPLFYVGIYAAISFGAALVRICGVIVRFNGTLRGSRIIFKQLLQSVVRATMRWHDSTPTGRILNRFSKDVETIDSSLGFSLEEMNSSMTTLFAAVFTVVIFTPPFILPAIIIGYIFYRFGIGYLNTGRDLRRMESNSRSPIFANFSELLIGIVTVRAFSAERRFLDNLHFKVDALGKMLYAFNMTSRWLLLRFDFLGGLAVLFTTLLALIGAIGAGYAGVTITSAMAFTASLFRTCRAWTQLELDLNSIERVVEYLELPQEPPLDIENSRPPAFWPSGSDNDSLIAVKDLVVSYGADLPPVLHGISFTLKAGERVGLLGRTGSGKSTLAMSLLRFTDPTSGTIHIDGIDITKIGLYDLRSRLTFVAQDAVLFSGTVRENIDPFNDYSDEQCLDVLSRVHLITDRSRSPSRAPSVHEIDQHETLAASSTVSATVAMDEKIVITLDTQVSAGGSNFSQGQRQLLTMARALLRQSSIIILDEATSSIDFDTDAKIQKTIRDEFKNSLLLTVAHRLRTIIDYDRLLVLDNGRIVEFDTPYNLIQKENGVFRGMCIHSGSFKELEDAATIAEAKRSSKE